MNDGYLNPSNNHCYWKIYKDNFGGFKWTQARDKCSDNGVYLVSFLSADEENKVRNGLGLTGTTFWIGANDREDEGKWKWTGGEAWGYTHWCGGEPNDNGWGGEDCGVMTTGGCWNDRDGGDRLKWGVCEGND